MTAEISMSSTDLLEQTEERAAPPSDAREFYHTGRLLLGVRAVTGGSVLLLLASVFTGGPALISLAALALTGAAVGALLDVQRRAAFTPDHIEVGAADMTIVRGGRRVATMPWHEVARVEHNVARMRIVLARRAGGAVNVDSDIGDVAGFMALVTEHIDATRRGDGANDLLARVKRPATFHRSNEVWLAAAALIAASIVAGLLLWPAALVLALFATPVLVWLWAMHPGSVEVDDSGVWIVRPFARRVIPFRAIDDVQLDSSGVLPECCVRIEHQEEGTITLRSFGAAALPMFDAIAAARRAQRTPQQAGSATHRRRTRFSALRLTAGLAAALLAVTWATVLTGVPLRTAARTGNAELLRIALLAGSPRNAADGNGLTALHHAAMRDDVAIIERLVHAGASVRAVSRPEGNTPLHNAARAGATDAIAALVAAGSNVDARNAHGRTPLAHALLGGTTPDPAVARALLDAGADPDQPDLAGRTALHHAAANGFVAWIELFGRAGTAANARDNDDLTPLHLAVLQRRTTVIAPLRTAGADIDASGPRGRTPLAEAASHLETPVALVDQLLIAHARADIADNDGWNAAQLAAAINNAPALELFARRRVNLDATAGSVPPALHIAIRRHNVDAVRALLRGGASPRRSFDGKSGYDVANEARNPTILALVRMR
jgi:ankyrin repeat protein